jgi:hypothetical protein
MLVGYSKFTLPFDSSDPMYQNCREYMGYLFALLVVCGCCGRIRPGSRLLWRTDNMAAMSWVQNNMCSSSFTQSSLMSVSILSLRLKLDVTSSEHFPGSTMGAVDALSRGYATDLDPSLYFHLQDNVHLLSLFRLCDPTVTRDLKCHLMVFKEIHSILDSFLSSC